MSVEAYEAAVNLLHRATTPSGIVASRHDILNYRRVFCRDAMICGLAGLLWEDEIIVQGLKTSLETLAEHQEPKVKFLPTFKETRLEKEIV